MPSCPPGSYLYPAFQIGSKDGECYVVNAGRAIYKEGGGTKGDSWSRLGCHAKEGGGSEDTVIRSLQEPFRRE